jgi:hypothetical protein
LWVGVDAWVLVSNAIGGLHDDGEIGGTGDSWKQYAKSGDIVLDHFLRQTQHNPQSHLHSCRHRFHYQLYLRCFVGWSNYQNTASNAIGGLHDDGEIGGTGDSWKQFAKSGDIVLDLAGGLGGGVGGTFKVAGKLKNVETKKVYRIYGDDARPDGYSWTPKNPNKIKDFRSSAGCHQAKKVVVIIQVDLL